MSRPSIVIHDERPRPPAWAGPILAAALLVLVTATTATVLLGVAA